MEKKNSSTSGYLLIAVFVVPLLIAVAMYTMRDNLPMVKSVSHGQLIHPAEPIENIELDMAEGEQLNLDQLQGKWTYILYTPNGCDLNCEASLFKLRQTRVATGREASRVQAVVVTKLSDASNQILTRYSQIKKSNRIRLNLESNSGINHQLETGKIYLIDPIGNLMMEYDANSTSRGMLKDIKKLLKISNIG